MNKLIVLFVSIVAVLLLSGQSFANENGVNDNTIKAEQLIGLNVNDLEGQHAGVIRDVNINEETGEINYVILGKSLLGIGEDRFAVPLEALNISNEKGNLEATLIVSEVRLLGAPTIKVGESPESFGLRLRQYYCSVPELDNGAAGLRQC